MSQSYTPKKVTAIEQLISDIHNNNVNHHSREIYLHGHVEVYDEEPGVDYRMATTFIKNLHILEAQNHQNILIHMHTIGGNWSDGMAMFNSIRLAKSPMTILSYAQASSMSGIILQAADKRVLLPDCEVMIHHGSIAISDNTMAAKSAIDQNERYCKRMLQIFAQRAILGKYFTDRNFGIKKTMSFIDSKIRQSSDWYLNAEEAIYYGFADGILGEKGFESISKIRSGRKKTGFK
jgi:ATP-dependent Clp protease, protease subunit